MNKVEFKRNLEELEELISRGKYAAAARKADSLDLEQIRTVSTLQGIAKTYEKVRRYADAEEILLQARKYAPKSRGLLFHLCNAATKAGNLEEARDFYIDFATVAPEDPERFVLQYRLAVAMEQPDPVLIEILENMKAEETDDHWMFVLAQLYERNGRREDALALCDEIELWYSGGKYVARAKELGEKLRSGASVPKKKASDGATGENFTESLPDEFYPGEDSSFMNLDDFDEPEPEKEKAPAEAAEPEFTEAFGEEGSDENTSGVASDTGYDIEFDTESADENVGEYEEEEPEPERRPRSFHEMAEAAGILSRRGAPEEEEPEEPEEEEPESVPAEETVPDDEAVPDMEEYDLSDLDDLDALLNSAEPEPKPEPEEEPEPEDKPVFGRLVRPVPPEVDDTGVADHFRALFGDDDDPEEAVTTINVAEEEPELPAEAASELQADTPEEAQTDTFSEIRFPGEEEVPIFPAEIAETSGVTIAEPDFPETEHPAEAEKPAEEAEEVTYTEPFIAPVEPEVSSRLARSEEGKLIQPSTRMEENSFRDERDVKNTLPRVDYDIRQVEKLNYFMDEDSSSILETIAQKREEGELFGDLASNTEVTNRTWHFIVYGNDPALRMECALDKLNEIRKKDRNCPKKVLKLNANNIANASIMNSMDRFLGNVVIVEYAGALSETQLSDFAKMLDHDDRSLLIVFIDSKKQIRSILNREPALADDFTGLYEARDYTARDLVNMMLDRLMTQDARLSAEGEMLALGVAQQCLREMRGSCLTFVEEFADRALAKAEKGGFLGLGSGKLDRENILIVDERHVKKAFREMEEARNEGPVGEEDEEVPETDGADEQTPDSEGEDE